ncbi:MAG: pseudouridine synthase [Gemmatales bacterium]|nr:rRNA pseudouridine synthase [Gemmatales bacterium]MDW8176100.1 pseudouridine synthase [Gemmatales bacterium]
MRLNRYLALVGLGSRRQVEDLIRAGRISVDGQVVRDLTCRVAPGQEVRLDGELLRPQRYVYWVVNKPPGYLSTTSDPQNRPKVVDLLLHVPERLFMVGRLDEESEGLMLLTNDGELAYRLTHPKFGVEKTYIVQVAGWPSAEILQELEQGVWTSAGKMRAQRVRRLGLRGKSTFLEITLTEGKNREIRRMLAKLGHKVMHLKRIAIGPLKLGRLKKGRARPLSGKELAALRQVAFAHPKPDQPTSRGRKGSSSSARKSRDNGQTL